MLSGCTDCLSQIVFGRDVVTVEDGARSMARDGHCDAFSDAGTNHIPDARAAKVVEDLRGPRPQLPRWAHS
jgi:hypothetical protein